MSRPRRARHGLTEHQLHELSSEMHVILHGMHFDTDEARQAAWFAHRDEAVRFHRRTNAGVLNPDPQPKAYYAYSVAEAERQPYGDYPPGWKGVRAGVGPPRPEGR